MILYHITPFRRVKSIQRRGLIPPTFLSNKRNLNQWILSYLIHFYNSGRGGNLSVFRVEVPNNWFYDGSRIYKGETNIEPEYVVGEHITQDRVKLLKTIPVKSTVKKLNLNGNLEDVSNSRDLLER